MRKLISIALAVAICLTILVASTTSVSATARDLQTYNIPVTTAQLGSLSELVGGHAQANLPWWVGEGIGGNRFFEDPLGDDTTMDGEATADGLRFWRSIDSEHAGHANNPVMGRRFGNNDENTWHWINIDAPLVIDMDATGNDELANRQRNIMPWLIWRVRDPAHGGGGVAVTLNTTQWWQSHYEGFTGWESGEIGRGNVRVQFNAPFRTLLNQMVEQGTQNPTRNGEAATAAQRTLDIAAANGGWFPIDRLTVMATVHHAGRENLGRENSALLRQLSWGVDANSVHPNEATFVGAGGPTPPPANGGPTPPTPPVGDNFLSTALVAVLAIVGVSGAAIFFSTRRRRSN